MNSRVDTTLTDIINRHLIDKAFYNDRSYDVIHPSSLGYCIRKPVFDTMYIPVYGEPSPRVLRIFDNGHSVHNRLEHYFKDSDILVEPELVLNYPPLNISGRTDSLIRINGNHSLVEIKSMKGSSYSWMVRQGKPSESFYNQLQLYFFLINEIYRDKYGFIDSGRIICENKDTQDWQEYFIWYDDVTIQKLIQDIILVNHCVVSGNIPRVEHDHTKFPCKWDGGGCDYYEFCVCEDQYSYNMAQIQPTLF